MYFPWEAGGQTSLYIKRTRSRIEVIDDFRHFRSLASTDVQAGDVPAHHEGAGNCERRSLCSILVLLTVNQYYVFCICVCAFDSVMPVSRIFVCYKVDTLVV